VADEAVDDVLGAGGPAGVDFAGLLLVAGGGVAWIALSPVRIGDISPAPAAGSARESGSGGSASDDWAWTERLTISVRTARSAG